MRYDNGDYYEDIYSIVWGFIASGRILIRDYYTTFSISALVSARDSHIKPESEAGGLIWVEGRYQRRYGKFHVIIYLSHILHWLFSSIYFQKRSLNWQIAKINPWESCFCSTCKYFCFEFCTMTLESVCKIYPRRSHLNGNSYSRRRIHLS